MNRLYFKIPTFAAAMLLAAPWQAAVAGATTGPALDDRISQGLLDNGSVDALAASTPEAPSNDPATLRAQVRLAFESGDLDTALPLLRASASDPAKADPQALRDLANVCELMGRDDAAKKAWQALIDRTPDIAPKMQIQLRLALLLLDDGQSSEAVSLLNSVATLDPAGAAQAGVIAGFYRQYSAAAGYLRDSGRTVAGLGFLGANAALHAGQLDLARNAYTTVLKGSADPRDAAYATERLVAVARQAGQLDALAAQWQADPNLPVERWLPLAIILRERGREAELLKWWHWKLKNSDQRNELLSQRFIAEISGAAIAVGSGDEIAGISDELLASDAGREQNFIAAERLLIDSGKLQDADKLFDNEIGKAINVPSRLRWLGKTASSLGRDQAAHQAAQGLIVLGGGNAVRGLLLDASIALRASQQAQAADSLAKAAALAVSYPEQAADTASLLDAAGMDDAAIALLQSVTTHHTDDDLQLQLTGLLIQRGHLPQAMDILDHLRRTTHNAGTAAQAGQRLLEIAGISKSYDRLAENLQTELADGGGAADMSLLADVYVAMHRSEAAASLIRATNLLDETARQQRLATLFLRLKEFDRADDALQQLVKIDPQHSIATLEQIAWVATEQKRGDEAKQTVDEISKRAGNGPIADELMGSIYDRLDRPDQASSCYRKALAAGASDPQDWLLWSTAMMKCGRPDVASQRLQILCFQAESEDVFTIAVDALLNLDSPVPAMRALRRLAMLSSSRTPQDENLLNLVRDLCDQLGDPALKRRVSETALAMLPDERSQLLRELSEESADNGDTDAAIGLGDSILASGDEFPPQVFLDLGEQLLIAQRTTDAGRALGRAIEASSDDRVATRVADIYEKYDRFSDAERVIAPLAERYPRDLALNERLAREREVLGRQHDAFELYLHGLDLAAEQWFAAPKMTADPAAVPTGDPTDAPPEEADFERLSSSAAATARQPQEQTDLIELLRRQINRTTESDSQNSGSRVPETVAGLSRAIEREAFISGQIDAADQADESVIAQWPDDVQFSKAALAARINSGLFDSAVRFAGLHSQLSQLPWALRSRAARSATSQPFPSAADVADLPMLVASGKTDQARQIVQSDLSIAPADADAAMPRLIAAASATSDDDAVNRWSQRWLAIAAGPLNRPRALRPGKLAAEKRVALVARTVWNVLAPAGREAFIASLIELGNKSGVPGSIDQPAVLALKLASADGIVVPERDSVIQQLLSDRASADVVAAELFACAQPADRPSLLQLALQSVAPSHQLALLLGITAQSPEAFDDATARAVVEGADNIPADQIFGVTGWFSNQAQKRVLPALANAMLKSKNSDDLQAGAETAIECAAAFAVGDQPERADALALQGLDQLMAKPPEAPVALDGAVDPAIRATQLVKIASMALSQAARDKLAQQFRSEIDSPAASAWRMICQATVLQTSGRFADALTLERRIYANHPDDEKAVQLLAQRLENDGRFAELVDTFGPRSGREFSTGIRQRLARSLRALYRPEESRQAAPKPASWPPIDASGPTLVAQEFRMQLAQIRAGDASSLDTASAPAAGGLKTSDDGDSALDATARTAVLNEPSLVDDVLALQTVLYPAPALKPTIQSIFDTAARAAPLREHLLQTLEARCSSKELLSSDAAILERLAIAPGAKLSPGLLDALRKRAEETDSDEAFAALGSGLAAENLPAAKEVDAWVPVRRRMNGNDTALGEPDDRALADRLIKLIGQNKSETAEKILESLRNQGRVTGLEESLGMIWARLAAERGDAHAFEKRMDDVLSNSIWEVDASAADIRLALPVRCRNAQVTTIADAAADSIERAARRAPDHACCGKSMAVVGSWALEQSSREVAQDVLSRAKRLADEFGSAADELAVADLATELGDDQLSDEIEESLLRDRCLPALRIQPLLVRLEKVLPADEFYRLADPVVTYCREPKLISWTDEQNVKPATEASGKAIPIQRPFN
jgi:tetratricopeptide (TPR) repeat protein